jgi:cell wall-associated NlpC family hydrolase
MSGKLFIFIVFTSLSSALFAAGELPDARPNAADFAAATTDTPTPGADGVVFQALALLGVHYRHGGRAPATGFDCSGLVRHVFREAQGMALPGTSREMSRVGEKIGRESMQPGDLVFYNTLQRAFSHVGIYLGENRFIHAPSTGSEVRIESMNSPYWALRFNGARRILATPSSR